MYDLAVIGAGPAGAILARKCASKGMKVALMDRRFEIGAPYSGGDLVNRLDLEEIGIRTDDFVTSDVDVASFSAGSAKLTLNASGGKADVFNVAVCRDRLDKELAALAAQEGAEVHIRTSVTRIDKENTGGFRIDCIREGKSVVQNALKVVSAGGDINSLPRIQGAGLDFPVQHLWTQYDRYSQGTESREVQYKIGWNEPFVISADSPYHEAVRSRFSVGTGVERTAFLPSGEGSKGNIISLESRFTVPMNFRGEAGGVILVGMQAGLFNSFFMTGFREAIRSAGVAADLILRSSEDSALDISGEYSRSILSGMLPEIEDSRKISEAIMNARSERIHSFLEYMSQYSYSQISLSELSRKSGMKTVEMIEMLADAY